MREEYRREAFSELVGRGRVHRRFYTDPAPWRNLRRVFASVQRDYPRARRLGHTLVTHD